MIDSRLTKWAELLTGYCTQVQAGDLVVIQGEIPSQLLLRAVHHQVVEAGGNPVVLPVIPGLLGDLLSRGNDDQLDWVNPLEHFQRTEADVSIRVLAETNTRSSSAIDPARNTRWSAARRDLMRSSMQRAATGDFRWALTMFPTDAYAQDANMSTDDFADFIFAACKLDQPDPVAAWTQLSNEQGRLIDWLAGKEELRILGPATDLTLSIAGRTWINSDGKRNFPSGEIFTGPIETTANGVYSCSFPVIHAGREMTGVRMTFADGLVIDASAEKNETYLLEALDTDPGARRLGEVAIGTNLDIDRFTGQTLLDEKIGGTAHIAIGAGYPDSGSVNQSAIHWDLITDLRQGGRIEADGQPIMIDGAFVI